MTDADRLRVMRNEIAAELGLNSAQRWRLGFHLNAAWRLGFNWGRELERATEVQLDSEPTEITHDQLASIDARWLEAVTDLIGDTEVVVADIYADDDGNTYLVRRDAREVMHAAAAVRERQP